MINSVFVNLNGADINVLNIEYLTGVIQYNFSKYHPQFYNGQEQTFVFDDKTYVISSQGCDGWNDEIKKFAFKIMLINHALISSGYNSIEEWEEHRNKFRTEVNDILKEYGHLILDNGIKKINV